jgi:hypothetical protein
VAKEPPELPALIQHPLFIVQIPWKDEEDETDEKTNRARFGEGNFGVVCYFLGCFPKRSERLGSFWKAQVQKNCAIHGFTVATRSAIVSFASTPSITKETEKAVHTRTKDQSRQR